MSCGKCAVPSSTGHDDFFWFPDAVKGMKRAGLGAERTMLDRPPDAQTPDVVALLRWLMWAVMMVLVPLSGGHAQ
jgi:hypothetical protein